MLPFSQSSNAETAKTTANRIALAVKAVQNTPA